MWLHASVMLLVSASIVSCSYRRPTRRPEAAITHDRDESTGRVSTVRATDGVRLYVEEYGPTTGQSPVIAIPGGPGISHAYILGLRMLARSGFRVALFDPRGVAKSSQPRTGSSRASAKPWTLERQAGDVESIREALGVDTVHVVGFSWGALLALTYATKYPKRTLSVVAVATGAPARYLHEDAARRFRKHVQELERAGLVATKPPSKHETCADTWKRLKPAYFSDPRSAAPRYPKPPFCNDEVARRVWQAMGDYDLLRSIGNVRAPMLVIHGASDPFGLQPALVLAESSRQAPTDLAILDGCGHRILDECRDRFLSYLEAFLHTAARSRRTGRTSSTQSKSLNCLDGSSTCDELLDELLK